ncbi:MAG TPA: cytochrome P450 [Thermoanaerobaculia bacterium]|nr:cytochrome P450 [Thermoanaerobaculia bacterium]
MTRAHPPGPRRVFFLRRQPETFLKLARTYGDLVYFKVGPRDVFLVSRPDLIQQMFRDSYSHFEKDWGPRRGASPLGNGLLTSEGAEHRAQRMDFSRIFARPAVEARRSEVAEEIDAWSARQRDGAEIDLFREMSAIGTSIAARVLFGVPIDPDVAHDAMHLLGSGFGRVMFPHAHRFRVRRDRGAPLFDLVRHVREHATGGGLLAPADLDDDQLATFLVTSQETIRIATTWSWLMLSANPSARDADAQSVLQESMRLHPPQWMIGRRTIAPYAFAGYDVPRGALVLASPYVVHRDPRYFEEPLRFDPSRWQKPLADRAAYFPFGGGARRCIGEAFAMMAGTMVLSQLSRDWTFECLSRDVRYDARLTLQPRAARARLSRR